MTVYQWLCVLGIPALTGAVLVRVMNRSLDRMGRTIGESAEAQKLGLQALLRSQLYELYDRCREKGCASHEERENFENLYRQYHRLGANGVMDNTRGRFLELPIRREE